MTALRAIAGGADRGAVLSSSIVFGSLALLTLSVCTNAKPAATTPVLAAVIALGVGYRRLLAWRSLMVGLVIVILFVPIRRYTIPGHLPFQLEPYRLLVAFITLAAFTSLLIDPRVRMRLTGFEGPLVLILFAIVGSDVVNSSKISELGVHSDVVKRLTFFISFFLVVLLVSWLVRRQDDIDLVIRALVAGGGILAVFAIYESLTGYNLFNHLSSFVPVLKTADIPWSLLHPTGHLRVYASAEHPIALGAVFAMILPFGFYLAQKTKQLRWWVYTLLLLFGAFATVSRTAIIMLLVTVVVFVRHRPKEMKKLWPALLPLFVVVHIALPGTIGSLKDGFFPSGGLIAQQQEGAGTRGSGRIADLGPSLHEWRERPILGQGFGTRIVDKERQNAPILDDQWLGTLLETGALGFAAWLWLFITYARRLGRAAKEETDPSASLLLSCFTAAVTSFAVGMAFYDAFSFIQVTFLMFILLGLGSSVLALHKRRTAAA
jgi:polysaccharide biosynthesis protein PslJ